LFIAGDYLYLATTGHGLQIFDISNPIKPRWAGAWQKRNYTRGVHVVGNYAYVATGSYGLEVLDVRDPRNPFSIATLQINAVAMKVFVKGQFAYVAARGEGLMLIDVKTPSSPKLIGDYQSATNLQGVASLVGLASVATLGRNIYLNGTHSQAIAALRRENVLLDEGLPSFYFVGRHAYVVPSINFTFKVFDVGIPDKPKLLGKFQTVYGTGPAVFEEVRVAGKYAFVSQPFEIILVLEISDPTKPTEVGRFSRRTFSSRWISLQPTDEQDSAPGVQSCTCRKAQRHSFQRARRTTAANQPPATGGWNIYIHTHRTGK
jgi:hypothetical protein